MPRSAMIGFLLVATTFWVSLSAYVGWRLGAGMPGPLQTAFRVFLAFNAILAPLSFMLLRSGIERTPLGSFLSWAAYTSMGFFSLLATFALASELLHIGNWLLERFSPGSLRPDRRDLLVSVLHSGALGVAGLVSAAGFVAARQIPRIQEVEIPIQGLPAALSGFRIAHLSDIHIGPTIGRAFLERVVERVNGLKPDMVAITGDLVDGRVEILEPEVSALTGLHSTHGTFFVTGNHEYYSGVLDWLGSLERMGISVLINTHRVLSHAGEKLVIAGITDASAGRMMPSHAPNPLTAISGAPDAISVLLAHQPVSAFDAAAVGRFALQLSGHTHGGQFFPFNLIIKLAQPFAVGLHRHLGMWIYTSPGTGYWGPPNRFGVPAEITLLRLIPA